MKKYLAAAALVVFASPVFAQSGMVANPTSSNEYVAAHVCVLLGLKGTDLAKCEESQAAGTAVDAPSRFRPRRPAGPEALTVGGCGVPQQKSPYNSMSYRDSCLRL